MEADNARADADIARDETDAAMLQNTELQRQIAELDARETEGIPT